MDTPLLVLGRVANVPSTITLHYTTFHKRYTTTTELTAQTSELAATVC